MGGRILTVAILVALTNAKAIVTNHCKEDVYVWSVPHAKGYPENLPIPPGKRYEEPWRYGDLVTPGIAIKVSPADNGINLNESEINFQYSVDPSDPKKIWINLATVRGHAFGDSLTFHTCHGPYKASNVSTRQCSDTDEIELVLCGTERTTSPQDSASPETITKCLKWLERRENHDSPAPTHVCDARVIRVKQPKQRPQVPGEQTDEHQEEIPANVPLKDVMRLEAAKYAADDTADIHTCDGCANPVLIPHVQEASAGHDEYANNKGPLCDLLHKSFPGAMCDEATAEYNAKLFYADRCGQHTRSMFPGTDCESVREELKKVYPDVDKPAAEHGATERSRRRECLYDYCNSRIPFACKLAELSLEANNPHVDYTTSSDVCDTDSEGRSILHSHNYTARMVRKKTRMCVLPAYKALGKYWGDDNTVRGVVNNLFYDVAWTSDREVCAKGTKYSVEKSHKPIPRCVKPYCGRNFKGADCGGVAKALNALSRDAGKNIDWTTDRKECLGLRRTGNGNYTSQIDPRMPVDLCKRPAYGLLTGYWGSQEAVNNVLNNVFGDVVWTDDDDCIQEIVVRHHQKEVKKCVKPFCWDSDSCSDVGNALGELAGQAGRNMDWTTDDDVCGSRDYHTHLPRKNVHPERSMTMCIKPFCAPFNPVPCSMAKWLFESQAWFHGANIRWSTDDYACYNTQAPKTDIDHHGRPRVCIQPLCNFINAKCEDVEDALEFEARRFGYNIDYTTDDDAC